MFRDIVLGLTFWVMGAGVKGTGFCLGLWS